MLKFLLDIYFAPKFFERSGRIYKFLGVHIFKRFLPTFGDYVLRFTGVRLIEDGSTKTLRGYEVMTRLYEAIHLVFCAFFLCSAGIILFVSSFSFWFWLLVAFFLNLIINVYPIMVQRYNRARIYKIIGKRNARLLLFQFMGQQPLEQLTAASDNG